jgi:hypothetical protein
MVAPNPVPLSQAMNLLGAKELMPTALRSKALAQLPAALRERALFSSGVQSTSFLEKLRGELDKVLSGRETQTDARARMKLMADELDPEEVMKDGRLNLILSTNVDMMRGYGAHQMTQQRDIMEAYPAWEFYRAEDRKEPRDWPARWAGLGGQFYPGASDYPDGRMIAAKDDPIWEQLSVFGLPHAPFDYNSGMDLQDVEREEAIDLGVIDPEDVPEPDDRDINEGLEAGVSDFAPDLASALQMFLSAFGVAHLGTDAILRFAGKAGQ